MARGKVLPRGTFAAVLAFVAFVALAASPFVLQGNSTPPWVRSALNTSPTTITTTIPSTTLGAIQLSSVATPVSESLAPASPPSGDLSREASLVAGEDLRLRTLLHHLSRLSYPVVVPVGAEYDVAAGVTRAGTPTLVLPGPATYTIDDLLANQAVIPLSQGGYMLEDNVLVGPGGTLKLTSADVPVLLMDSSDSGFTSLVTWGGTLSLSGTSATTPLVVEGWSKATNAAAVDRGYGRPYIRAVGGELDLKYVRASHLGFWSGRTGGVAWTGISSKASTGSAVSSRFMYNAYGAFVSRAQAVKFSDDLFEANELDGLRLHRLAVGSIVDHSAAARNAGNGFVVGRGATADVLQDDLSVNNAGNGYLLDGLALVNGASPSGDKAVASQGTLIEKSDAESNARTGILVEGGTGTIVRNNIVCGPVTGIAVRSGADQTYIVGNEVRCGGRTALSVGPSVTATTIDGNLLNDARIGLLIRNAPGVRVIDNRITNVSVFGISIRGNSAGVVGNSNVIAGKGFQPIDTRGGASVPTFVDTNTAGWQHRTSLSFFESLRYHPLLAAWMVILCLVAVFWIVSRLRRRPVSPYHYAVPWRPAVEYGGWAATAVQPPVAAMSAVGAGGAPVSLQIPAADAAPETRRPGRTRRLRRAAAAGPQPYAGNAVAAASTAAAAELAELKQVVELGHSAEPAHEVAVEPVSVAASSVADDGADKKGGAPTQFWTMLAAGNWTAEQPPPRVPTTADLEAPA